MLEDDLREILNSSDKKLYSSTQELYSGQNHIVLGSVYNHVVVVCARSQSLTQKGDSDS